ncbi:MAG: hypothetical protein Q8L57_01440, partial [bacterium]|nr:hypothetical protein [bacterium]
EIEKLAIAEGYAVMKLGNPDINTLDYEDAAKNRPPEILTERVKNLIADREREGKFQHILVFHELPLTVKSLTNLIPYFKTLGYEFVRLDEIKRF